MKKVILDLGSSDLAINIDHQLDHANVIQAFDTGAGAVATEGFKYVVTGVPVAPFDTFSENDVVEYENGAWILVKAATEGLRVYDMGTASAYNFDGTNWDSIGGATLVETEILDVSANTVDTTTGAPLGLPISTDYGILDVNSDFQKEGEIMIESGDISGTTISGLTAYIGKKLKIVYLYNPNL